MAVILMIDDDREVLEINKKYLTGEGFDVSIASSAEQGIRLAKQCSPDCILLDVMMPDRNGYEVCHILRTFTSVRINMTQMLFFLPTAPKTGSRDMNARHFRIL